MRVLMVHPHDVYDPLEPWTIRVTALARCLTELGHEVKVVYHLSRADLLPGDARHRQEFPFEVVPLIRHMGTGFHKAKQLAELGRWADVVHVQKALAHAALPSAAAAFWNRVPLHYDWDDWEAQIYADTVGHDRHHRRIDRFERALPRIADTVSVASRALAEQALAMGVHPEDLFDAPVGADLERFDRGGDGEALRAELALDGPIALYLGQLAGAHAAPLFLDAAALVLRDRPDAGFLVVGGGRTLPDLKEHAERLGISHRVRFTGAVPQSEVPRYMDVADVAVATLPDTPQAATKSPLKVVEYMAAGRAIVASAVGEAVRFLGDAGRLVPPGSASALADAVGELLGDPHTCSELGVAARERLRGHFTWAHTAATLESAYVRARIKRRLLPRGRGPSRGLGPEGLGTPRPNGALGASYDVSPNGVPRTHERRIPQSGIGAPPPPPVDEGAARSLLKAPVQRVKEAMQGRLDLAGVLHGELAYTGPWTIQLDVTNRCNNDCIACWLHSPLLAKTGPNAKDRRAQLRFDLVRQMLDDAAAMGTRDIYMAGGGDPIVYPWLKETVEHAKSHGMTVAINTNFALGDEAWCDWACEVGLDDMTISVWAGTEHGFDATHPNKKPEDFHKLKRLLTYLNKRKREVGQGPTIKLYQVVSNLNWTEFDAMYELVEETGSDAVEYTVVDTVPGHTDVLLFDDDARRELVARSEALQRRLDASGESHRLFGFDHWLRRIKTEGVTEGLGDASIVHTFPCTIGWTFLRVMPDGNVTSCLKSHRIPIGNLNEARLATMWNNERQRTFRRMTNVREKRDPWFSNIGNDPDVPCGCEKSCDDLGRNLATWRRMEQLSGPERLVVKHASKVLAPL
jgi:glycosyltransferase involved in cell wall biosynthesis/MoaA/NifB/PqqE/SkfB family radical SAM enzyme